MWLPALSQAALPQAWDDATGPEMALVQVQLTDAPADAIASTVVWISKVHPQGCADGEEGEGEGPVIQGVIFTPGLSEQNRSHQAG